MQWLIFLDFSRVLRYYAPRKINTKMENTIQNLPPLCRPKVFREALGLSKEDMRRLLYVWTGSKKLKGETGKGKKPLIDTHLAILWMKQNKRFW